MSLLNLISIKSLLWFTCGFGALIYDNSKKIQIFIFICLLGILFSVPNITDTAHYLKTLSDGHLYGKEIGYQLLQKILISILSPEGTILVIKIIMLSIPLIYIYKYNLENFFYSSNLFILTVFLFLSVTNNLRQGLCIIFFSIGILCFNKNKFISISLIIFACTFHYFSVPFLLGFTMFFIVLNSKKINRNIFIFLSVLSIVVFANLFNEIIQYFGLHSWTISNSWAEPSRFDTRLKVIFLIIYVLITNYFIKIDDLNIRNGRFLFIFFITCLLFFSLNYEIINRIIFFLYAFDAFILLYFLVSRKNLLFCKVLTSFFLISPNIYKILIK